MDPGLMQEWFDIKIRGLLGPGPTDVKEITILAKDCEIYAVWFGV